MTLVHANDLEMLRKNLCKSMESGHFLEHCTPLYALIKLLSRLKIISLCDCIRNDI